MTLPCDGDWGLDSGRKNVEHGARHGTGLLTALRAYLKTNGYWESAAATIGVHRHTMRKRIEALLGIDLGVAQVRAELLLAAPARVPGGDDAVSPRA